MQQDRSSCLAHNYMHGQSRVSTTTAPPLKDIAGARGLTLSSQLGDPKAPLAHALQGTPSCRTATLPAAERAAEHSRQQRRAGTRNPHTLFRSLGAAAPGGNRSGRVADHWPHLMKAGPALSSVQRTSCTGTRGWGTWLGAPVLGLLRYSVQDRVDWTRVEVLHTAWMGLQSGDLVVVLLLLWGGGMSSAALGQHGSFVSRGLELPCHRLQLARRRTSPAA